MSQIHVKQIQAYLHREFDSLIDMADAVKASGPDREATFLTRALAASALTQLAAIDAETAAKHVTDGTRDNGLDAVLYAQHEACLYLVQAKWHSDGQGTIDRAGAQKFIKGFKDLIVPKFDRFNSKIKQLTTEVENALNDSRTHFVLVVVHSGQSGLDKDIDGDFTDVLDEMNDTSEVVTRSILAQRELHQFISQGASGTPVDVDVTLFEWGQVTEPYQAYYGQVAASDVATWWNEYYPRICTPNIRMFLGDTDVNESVAATLQSAPENFWYFNNGITALCSSMKKKPIGGNTRTSKTFECKHLRIVNGAQTAGAIARADAASHDKVERARVPIRIITLDRCPEDFDREITRTNNTQNRIEARDFVAMDPEQSRLRNELLLEKVTYAYKSGDLVPPGTPGFNLTDATVALACAYDDIAQSTHAKRGIGRLWESIEKPPYKLLFNGALTGPALWRHVQVLRAVDEALLAEQKKVEGRARSYAVHGNRFIAHMIFSRHRVTPANQNVPVSDTEKTGIAAQVADLLKAIPKVVDKKYPDCYLASLFKNGAKCADLKTALGKTKPWCQPKS